jgi:hypothetical protein
MTTDKDRPVSTTAWAWVIQSETGRWLVCKWAEPTRDLLLSMPRPSPEARAIRVRLDASNRKDW